VIPPVDTKDGLGSSLSLSLDSEDGPATLHICRHIPDLECAIGSTGCYPIGVYLFGCESEYFDACDDDFVLFVVVIVVVHVHSIIVVVGVVVVVVGIGISGSVCSSRRRRSIKMVKCRNQLLSPTTATTTI